MGEEGRVNQAIQHHDHNAQDIYNHPKAADGQELWRCKGIGDTSNWDANVGIGKSSLRTEAIPGKKPGNGVLFRKIYQKGQSYVHMKDSK